MNIFLAFVSIADLHKTIKTLITGKKADFQKQEHKGGGCHFNL